MFGYIMPFKDELKIKEFERYKKYYCALCNQIRRRYGRTATIFLSYEMVFTVILLDDFSKKSENMKLGCQFDIIRMGEVEVSKDLIAYIAWINLHLSFWKLKDNWIDEKKISSYILYKLFLRNKAYKNDCEIYAEICHYHVQVFFDDGKIIEYDATNDLKGAIFKPLQDIAIFKETCTVLNDTLAWDLTGNRNVSDCIDIDPFTLYELPAINSLIA